MATTFNVDDDLLNAKPINELLEERGFQVNGTAFNGQIIIEKPKILQEKPDVVIMDYRNLIMKGIVATFEILNIINRSRIISATADEDIKEKALEIGGFSFVCKPFNFEEMLAFKKN